MALVTTRLHTLSLGDIFLWTSSSARAAASVLLCARLAQRWCGPHMRDGGARMEIGTIRLSIEYTFLIIF
jgi:hypothetical protein